jgi:hypothetical protein
LIGRQDKKNKGSAMNFAEHDNGPLYPKAKNPFFIASSQTFSQGEGVFGVFSF